MKIWEWFKGVMSSMFLMESEKVFGVDISSNTLMDCKITEWMNTYKGFPVWANAEQRIKSIKFAKTICSETARLTTLALGIQFDGGARADWMGEQCDRNIMPRLRNWVEYGCALGTIVLKPTGSGVDMFLPGRFYVVATDNGKANDVIFQDSYEDRKNSSKRYFTKLERHSFMRGKIKNESDGAYKEVVFYHIQNKAFVSTSDKNMGKEISLMETRWSGLQADAYITKNSDERLNTMLFGVLKMPMANDIDVNSALGISIFSDAMKELEDLDIAYSRNVSEIYDSETIELLDERLIEKPGKRIGTRTGISLPHHVRNVIGGVADDFYQAIERPLHTADRIQGINQLLSFVGYKCGYSDGYFVFDQKTGMVTATQVEADDRRTIQLIKDIRDALKCCLEDLFYAVSVFADIYGLVAIGNYKVSYDFGDITYNWEEDRARHWQYVQSGKYPLWRYYVKFEGMSEEDAKVVVKEAQGENKELSLFGEDE